MEQRPLRLGDILDDYCPRERRLTNHAVVAIVEDKVKQTRCTTCDAEHAYKGGREPRRRRKDTTSVLYNEVLAGMSDAPERQPVSSEGPSDTADPTDGVAPNNGNGHGAERVLDVETETTPPLPTEPAPPLTDDPGDEPQERGDTDDGPIHRRLIRATLPRPEGQKEIRQAPDFTMRAPNGNRPHGQFRGDRTRGQTGNGNNNGRARRFGGGQAASGGRGRGGRPGFGGGNQHRQGGGRKRSR